MKVTSVLYLLLPLIFIGFACNSNDTKNINNSVNPQPDSSTLANNYREISAMLYSFNIAAANADFNKYFSFYTNDAVFMGTDATEYWNKDSFMVWAKPFFDKGKAWNFKSMQRHIYFDKTGNLAWFDELLNTQMKICRGSGVVIKQGNSWKVQQYILSMTVPNSEADPVIKIKTPVEDSIISRLTNH